MASHRGKWTSLQARLSVHDGIAHRNQRQAGLWRGIAARMNTRGIRSWQEYSRLLQSSPSEFTALAGVLRASLCRQPAGRGTRERQRRGSSLRQWIESLAVPALVAEAMPGRAVRVVACNGPARELLGTSEGTVHSLGSGDAWLHLDQTPCREEDTPLYQALWRGAITRDGRFLFRDSSGQLRPLLVDACPVPGRRARAFQTMRAADSCPASRDAAPSPSAGAAAQEQRYRRLFDESSAAAIVTSQSGTILEVNGRARELVRAHAEDLEGAALGGLLADEALPAFHEALLSLARSGRAAVRLTLLAQSDLVLEAQAREIRMAGATLVEWVLHDITAHVRAERLRRDLVDLVLHDLRGPLATTALGIEAAERGLERSDMPRAQRALSMVAAALRRLGRLTDSLLDTSRLEAGQPILRLTEVKPDQLLSSAVAEEELALAARNLQLEVSVSPGLPTVVADGDMLFRAVINLLDNAIKFSPPHGRIQLWADAQDHGLLIRITDQGPGVPRELQPRIFDKFIGQHVPHAPRSYGLGLAFCKLAVEAHGGWVAVDSSAGHGSTFALWLPARPEFPDVVS